MFFVPTETQALDEVQMHCLNKKASGFFKYRFYRCEFDLFEKDCINKFMGLSGTLSPPFCPP